MAFYDFTGANGDPLPSGLTAQNGTFEIFNNSLRATNPNPSGPLWVCTQASLADATTIAVVNCAGTTSNTTGVCFRYSDNNNLWMAVINGFDGELVLFDRQSGTFTNRDSYAIPSFNASTNYEVKVVTSGNDIEVYLDGVLRISFTSAFNNTATESGLRFGNNTHEVRELTVTDAPAGTIIVNEPNYNNKVYQRNTSNQAALSFPVTYTGTPTSLEYRLLDASDDTTELLTWTVFDTSPTGGTSTLNFNRIGSTTGIHVEVRFSNDTGVTDLQTLDWYVGDIVLIIGQSLAARLNSDYAITAESSYFVWNGSAGVVPTVGAGANEIARNIVDGYGVACLIINTAVGGSPLTFEADSDTNNWANSASTLFSDTTTALTNATDGNISFAWWHQGTRDSMQGVTFEQYLRMNQSGGLTSLFKNLRDSVSDPDGNTLPILSASLGRDTRGTGSTDSSHQGIRNAQLTQLNADPHIYQVPAFWTALVDGVHATEAGAIKMAGQIMAAKFFQSSDITQDIPRLISVDIDGGRTNLTLYFNEDLETSDTNYATEGVRIEDNGSPVTVSSHTRVGARTTQVALGSAIGVGATVRVYLMYGAGTTNVDLAYPRTASVTLPGTAGSVNIICEAANALLDEI